MFLSRYIRVFIVRTPPPLFFLTGGVNFNYLLRRGESEKLKKGGGSMAQGQVFLGGGLALLLFYFFKVYHFYILKLFYSLENSVIHLKKNYVCICKEGVCVGLVQERGSLREGGGNCLKYLKRGEKEVGNKSLKRGASWVKGWVP